jgi:N-acetylneuraminic acid mutarotase
MKLTRDSLMSLMTSTSFLFFQFGIFFGQSWQQSISFPGTPRDDASHFKINTRHYIGTGREIGFACTRDFYFFDESIGDWGVSAPLPTGKERQYANANAWNGNGYLFGGEDCAGNYLSDLWFYNPSSDSWTELTGLPSLGRAGSVNFILHDTLYIIGGRNSTGILNEVWCYDLISHAWTQKNSLPSNGIWRGTAFTFENIAYIGLGRNNLNNQTDFNTEILSYLTNTDSWSVVANLNWNPRSHVGSTQTDSLLFLFGGVDSTSQILTSSERVHLTDFSMDLLPDFPSVARKGGIAFVVQNDLYYSTGVSTDTRFNETWKLVDVASFLLPAKSTFKVFPNPSSEKISISGIPESIYGTQATLSEINGQYIRNFTVTPGDQIFDVSDFKKGLYLLKIGGFTHKIVKD